MARALIGTSGWAYSGWRGSFYPQDLPASKFLEFYSRNFKTAEVNYSFYHLPRVSTYEKWYGETPEDFVFALKASRLITHVKRLRDARENWHEFLSRARALKHKLGPILLQFPSSFRATGENVDALARFLDDTSRFDSALRLALEFRDTSWFASSTLALLEEQNAALVIAHSSRYPVPEPMATASFVYFRFHGPKELFASGYSKRELAQWAKQIERFLREGRDAYAYFNNDARGDAVPNAQTLCDLLAHSS